MYTIGQVSEMFHLPISTLRYYDKEGLFPSLERQGNIRKFSDKELDELRMIECLKKSGLEIKDIKQFFKFVTMSVSQRTHSLTPDSVKLSVHNVPTDEDDEIIL